MLSGNPLLATYSLDGTIRTFELVGGVFVPLANVGGYTQGSNPPAGDLPLLGWAADQLVFFRNNPAAGAANTQRIIRLFEGSSLAVLDTVFSNASAADRGYRPVYGILSRTIGAVPFASGGATNKMRVDDADIVVGPTTFTLPVGDARSAHSSKDGRMIAIGRPTGVTFLMGPADITQGHSYAPGAAQAIPVDVAVWDATDRFLICGEKGSANLSVIEVDYATQTSEHTLTIQGPGTLQSLAAAQNGKFVAAGWLDGAVRTTVIYRRAGGYLLKLFEFTDIGRTLEFTADGQRLIDVASRKALRYDALTSTFVEDDASMANVPAGTSYGVTSEHVAEITSEANFYQTAIDKFAEQAVDYQNLKMTLMVDGAAPFNMNDATIATVIGDDEVSTGGFPVGGVAIANVMAMGGSAGMASVIADDPNHVAIESDMLFRYAVIYDATDDAPLIHYDFGEEVLVLRNNRIVFSLADLGLLTFAG